MDIADIIYTRRSVRQYQDKPVDKDTIRRLLDAAAQAPSAMNTQPWVFGVIQDADALKGISDRAKAYLVSILDKVPALETYRGALENPEFNIFYNATTLVLICSKPDASPDPVTDCCLAAENLMLMARQLDLGTCWIGFSRAYFGTPEGKQELGLPEGYNVVAPIIVGYPMEELSTMDKNPPEILFWK